MTFLALAACVAETADSAVADPASATTPAIPRGALQFRFPLVERELFEQTTGVDHDPAVYDPASLEAAICTNYDGRGFPWCYDEHDGSGRHLARK